jgi:hypothetical protein
LLVLGEVAEDPALLFTAERRVREDDVDPLLVADLAEGEAERLSEPNPSKR